MKNKEDNYSLSNREKLNIIPITDLHIGSPNCNYESIKNMIKYIKGIKSPIRIYCLGDLIDVGSKQVGNSCWTQTMSVDEQVETLIKTLKPIKHLICGFTGGNHDLNRLQKEFDLDINPLICEALGITEYYHKYSIEDNIIINDKPYTIYGLHGTKSSSQKHLALGVMQRQLQHINADLYLMGHMHLCASIDEFRIINNKYFKKTYCICGSHLTFKDSYAEAMHLRAEPCGFAHILIDNERDNQVKFIRDYTI